MGNLKHKIDNNELADKDIYVHSWMTQILGLKPSEALIYALIHEFCADGKSEYCGSLEYIAKQINTSVSCTCVTLKKLINKGLIIKQATGNRSSGTRLYTAISRDVQGEYNG